MNYLKIIIVAAAAILATTCSNVENEIDMNTSVPKISDFPIGEENTIFAQYFSGRSWLAPLTTGENLHVPMFNVTFEPKCRNNWHKHSEGQVLIAVGGAGYFQERGKAAVRMEPSDVIEVGPNVEHWHGAAPDSWFSHLAITPDSTHNKTTWLEPVTNEVYVAATK